MCKEKFFSDALKQPGRQLLTCVPLNGLSLTNGDVRLAPRTASTRPSVSAARDGLRFNLQTIFDLHPHTDTHRRRYCVATRRIRIPANACSDVSPRYDPEQQNERDAFSARHDTREIADECNPGPAPDTASQSSWPWNRRWRPPPHLARGRRADAADARQTSLMSHVTASRSLLTDGVPLDTSPLHRSSLCRPG